MGLSEEVGKVSLGQTGESLPVRQAGGGLGPRWQAQHTLRNGGGKSQVCLGSSGSRCLECGAEREVE